jgi:hypothetical protein
MLCGLSASLVSARSKLRPLQARLLYTDQTVCAKLRVEDTMVIGRQLSWDSDSAVPIKVAIGQEGDLEAWSHVS